MFIRLRKWVIIFTVAVLGFNAKEVDATHIMGGDLEWEKITQDSFKVTIRVYRDCHGVDLYDTDIKATSNCGSLSVTPSMSLAKDVTPACKGQCTRCSSASCGFNYGVQEFELVALFDFGDWKRNGCCEVELSWAQCCRNKAITTIASYNQSFYIDGVLNICINGQNTSPKWGGRPVALGCLGADFIYDFGADDFDVDSTGAKLDSLVYALDTPKRAKSTYLYWRGSNSHELPFTFRGFPNLAGPYPNGFHFDETSGFLAFSPVGPQVSIVSIRVEEYRKGVKVGETHREVQLAAIYCYKQETPFISNGDCANWFGREESIHVNRCIGDSLQFEICTQDRNFRDTVKLELKSKLPPGANFKIVNPSSSRPVGRISWFLDSTAMLHAPWDFTFKATDNGCPLNLERTKRFRVFIGTDTSFLTSFSHHLVDTNCAEYLLTGGSLDTLSITSQHWYVNDTLVGAGDSIYFTPTSMDTQFVKVLMKRNGCFSVHYDTVLPPPFRPIRIGGFLDTTLCHGSIYVDSIQVLGGTGAYSYQWDTKASSIVLTNKNTKHISFYAKSGASDALLNVTVTDTSGCTARISKELDVIDAFQVDVDERKSTYLICTDDSFKVELTVPSMWPGRWEGPGVRKNVFYSAGLPDGSYRFDYTANMGTYCITDWASIRFGVNPDVQVDDYIGTCVNHADIPLKAIPSGGLWENNLESKIGIVRDSFFQMQKKGKYRLSYVYTSPAGCVDTVFTEIEVGKWNYYLNIGPDGELCSGYPELALTFNGDSIWPSSSTDRRVLKVGSDWYTNQKQLKFGENGIVMQGINRHYCLASNDLKISYLETPATKLNVGTSSLCLGDDSVELIVYPDTSQFFGDNISERNGKKYLIPADSVIGSHQYKSSVTGSNGCVGTDSITINVRDTVIRPFKIGKLFCAFDTVELKDLTDSGYWEGDIDVFKDTIGKWFATADDSYPGRRYVYYKTYHDTSCFLFDTSFLSIHVAPKPQIKKSYEVCADTDEMELESSETGVVWYGKSIINRGKDYYFKPELSLVGRHKVVAHKYDSKGCKREDSASVRVRDIPKKPFAGYDDHVCLPFGSDTISYRLPAVTGKWEGKALVNQAGLVLFHKSFAQKGYPYVLTISDGKCGNSDTTVIFLGRKLKTSFTVDKAFGAAPLKVVFTDKTPGVVHNRWSFGTGDTAMNRLYPQYTYLDTGQYDVALVAYDSMRYCGERLIRSNYISVSETNSLSETTGGINIFPNPVRDILVVNSSFKQVNVPYSIYDINGQLLIDGQLDFETGTSLKVSELRPGQYLLELRFSDEDVRSISFIKR